MALVVINDKYLTDIANAIRSKSDTPEAIYQECKVSKSNNASGFDNVRTGWFQYSDNKRETITIKGASYLQVRIAYVHTTSTNTLTVNDQTFTLTPSYKDIYEENLTIEGDTVTFVAETQYSSMSNLGYYAEVRGYDAEGNFIPYFNNMYKPREMAPVIEGMSIVPENAFVITGDCAYRFGNKGWDWFIRTCGDKVTTKDIDGANDMFVGTTVTEIPFVINMAQDNTELSRIFSGAEWLTTVPKVRLNLVNPSLGSIDFSSMLQQCIRLKDVEGFFDVNDLEILASRKLTASYSCPEYNQIFYGCQSLRKIPSWWYKLRISEESTAYPAANYTIYSYALNSCHALDEVILPVVMTQGAQTSNMFNQMVNGCNRLKNATFETNEDGTPKVVQWKSQIIDFTSYVGYSTGNAYINVAGITLDKGVNDDADYQALKDDPDWFTTKIEYSRYNHDSAVATINSLPDTSAYLATAGGTNTIKFKGASGSATDGGAINTLTEEEIAIASAKGWTVTLA
jgi:hypothetical protein